MDLGRFRGFVRGRDAGELGNLTTASLGVESLDVAGFADGERGVDEDLDERVVREGGAGLGAVGGQRSDEGDERDVARAGEESCDGGGTTDAFGAVGGGETEIAIQRDAEVVAIDADDVAAGIEETALDGFGDGRLTRAGEAREPDDCGRMTGAGATFGGGDLDGRRFRFRDRVEDDAAAMDAAAFFEGEATRDGALAVQIVSDVTGGADDHFADRVAGDAGGFLGFERGGVGDLDDLGDDRIDVLGEQA